MWLIILKVEFLNELFRLILSYYFRKSRDRKNESVNMYWTDSNFLVVSTLSSYSSKEMILDCIRETLKFNSLLFQNFLWWNSLRDDNWEAWLNLIVHWETFKLCSFNSALFSSSCLKEICLAWIEEHWTVNRITWRVKSSFVSALSLEVETDDGGVMSAFFFGRVSWSA